VKEELPEITEKHVQNANMEVYRRIFLDPALQVSSSSNEHP